MCISGGSTQHNFTAMGRHGEGKLRTPGLTVYSYMCLVNSTVVISKIVKGGK